MLNLEKDFPDRHVCVLGLGYVGLTLAAVMAEVGFKVIGVEIRDDVLRKLKNGQSHFYEPGLDDLLKRLVKEKRIKFAKHIPSNVRASVYIITVGTPLDPHGKVRLDMVENVTKEVGRHLRDGDLVITRSTMKIGTTRKVIAPLLKKKNIHFDLAFCPERTLEGQALSELRFLPQIVGGLNFKSAIRASQIFQFLTPTVLRVSDMETAEVIKLIDNASRDVHFAYANEVARICDAVGVSALEVIRSGKTGYSRTNLPIPGLVGGPCLEKDPYILAEGLQEAGIEPEITLRSRRLNEQQPHDVIDFVAETISRWKGIPSNPVISLLGIAFKGRPVTDDLRGTMARPVFAALRRNFPRGIFRGYDPVVSANELRAFGLKPTVSLNQAFKGAHLALILNNHPEFSGMPISTLAKDMAHPSLVYDFWNSFGTLDPRLPAHVGYMALGSHGRAILPSL